MKDLLLLSDYLMLFLDRAHLLTLLVSPMGLVIPMLLEQVNIIFTIIFQKLCRKIVVVLEYDLVLQIVHVVDGAAKVLLVFENFVESK